ncbi:hypothetical protein IT779_07305 [Nocardia sp. NEAU-351]|uniref:Amino acid transporter n=2 Tax=Nocardia bovistercoris TaxID=2785916 RepID=A0A931IA29_9NOCA|nr:hypothetical protein [Nocardia bovistercoris]MBH0776088.1 hypothetical protein [Nocardia bovistercoris]
MSAEEADKLWAAWTPGEFAERMAGVGVSWYVAAGWALDLFTGGGARAHSDLEIGVAREDFREIESVFAGWEWEVVGDGRVWAWPEEAGEHHQTWLREPESGLYRVDVFREPRHGDRWVCRRDSAVTLPYSELILRTEDGIPYSCPEVALLFKAKALRDKDSEDFRRVLPALNSDRRARLAEWLTRVHPGHPWIEQVA